MLDKNIIILYTNYGTDSYSVLELRFVPYNVYKSTFRRAFLF